ncbi:endolytic transglycosylase MltG [Idiomarina xiamenensis]|uniref:Endolytic murein transglycosylase n=1 Tax=Idiomarina xiamenensis 10-D-4 TaxID=740709 RepID=K2KWT3_9GAMM|nr:endolytic transglycosylase MltG [Idiomarina xiamenensis]EKE86954.1 aminodeoxychorismate lyase [Idiomarina xiamenensis 10-D-4]
MKFMAGVFLLIMVLIGSLWFGSQYLLQQPLQVKQAQLIEVKPGSHARSVLRQLSDMKILPEPPITIDEIDSYYWSSRIQRVGGAIRAGVYQLQVGDTLADFWQRLSAGEQHQFRVTLVEGQTLQQWLQRLAEQPYLQYDSATLSATQLQQAIAASSDWQSLEGMLFPDTYSYTAYTSDLVLLRQAYQRMQDELQQVWQQRNDQVTVSTPYELVILASIIEKETGVASERELVASVFANRMRKGMRLQSDPTTIYGISDFDGNLTRAHLREKTPFNTYRIDGLPPTPIAMPGLASLQAAAAPIASDYYYFVANGKGEHVFSETLQQHNRAVNRYQRGIMPEDNDVTHHDVNNKDSDER